MYIVRDNEVGFPVWKATAKFKLELRFGCRHDTHEFMLSDLSEL